MNTLRRVAPGPWAPVPTRSSSSQSWLPLLARRLIAAPRQSVPTRREVHGTIQARRTLFLERKDARLPNVPRQGRRGVRAARLRKVGHSPCRSAFPSQEGRYPLRYRMTLRSIARISFARRAGVLAAPDLAMAGLGVLNDTPPDAEGARRGPRIAHSF